jgi:hypothetical protein
MIIAEITRLIRNPINTNTKPMFSSPVHLSSVRMARVVLSQLHPAHHFHQAQMGRDAYANMRELGANGVKMGH